MIKTKLPIRIAVLPGDGIGEEVIHAGLPVFQQLNISVDLKFGKIGWECWREEGNPIPQATWDLIKQTDTCLLGAITSKPLAQALQELPDFLQGKEIPYISPVIQLRQKLGLFANVRPIFNVIDDRVFNFTIIRENTEGLYAGLDYKPIPEKIKDCIKEHEQWKHQDFNDASCTIRLQTANGLYRLFNFAFAYARQHGFKKVTLADKPNVMRQSGHFAKSIFDLVAVDYAEIENEILNVDAVGLWMVRKPENFGVIVAENMFGDILSDVGAGIMGGLGFAPSANIGSDYCYFEPVHGSAPDHAGKNRVNPSAMFLTISLLLERFGYVRESKLIKEAITMVVSERKFVTYDLGGNASTIEMANAILAKIADPVRQKTVAFIATGDELVKGEILDTNSQYFAKKLTGLGVEVTSQQSVIDNQNSIEQAILYQLSQNDCIVLCGGLGPTSDDRTRFALANVIKQELLFNQAEWDYICNRLKGFGIVVHESNRQQALFPKDAEILHNPNGTAAGCKVYFNDKIIFMLPGPPKECIPMFEKHVVTSLINEQFTTNRQQLYWKLIGVIEADLAAKIDSLVQEHNVITSYRWNYPYLDLKVLHAIESEEAIQTLVTLINKEIEKHIVATQNKTSLELLKDYLNQDSACPLFIKDNLTKGKFKQAFGEHKHIRYVDGPGNLDEGIYIASHGLENFHEAKPFGGTTDLLCTLKTKDKTSSFDLTIAYRGSEVIDYGIHFMAYCICKTLEQSSQSQI